MKPAITPIGTGAAEHVGYALQLHRQMLKLGKKRHTEVVDGVLFVITEKLIIIKTDVFRVAIFLETAALSGSFNYSFEDDVPAALVVTEAMAGLSGFFPSAAGEVFIPEYNRVKFYAPDNVLPALDLVFITPILSAHGESLSWLGGTFQAREADNWLLLRYQLNGYVSPYEMPTSMKLLRYAEAATWEYDLTSGTPIVAATGLVFGGISCHRIRGEIERIFTYVHEAGIYSGHIYDVVELDTGLDLVPLAIPVLPVGSGSRLFDSVGTPYGGATCRRIEHRYDVFTSEEAQHFYFVVFTSDAAVMARITPGNPYPNDTWIMSNMSLKVEKRRKDTLALVHTFNLDPTNVDVALQSIIPLVQIWNVKNSLNDPVGDATPDFPTMTRFVPPTTGATVLVDNNGNEFPILPVISVSQDWFDDTFYGVESREVYINTGFVRPTLKRNQFQQAALLWLTGPVTGFDGHTWDGVEAIGLKISETQPAYANTVGIGGMSNWGSIIGDGQSQLASLKPFLGTDAGQGDQQRVISVRLADNVPVVKLERVQSVNQGLFMFDI